MPGVQNGVVAAPPGKSQRDFGRAGRLCGCEPWGRAAVQSRSGESAVAGAGGLVNGMPAGEFSPGAGTDVMVGRFAGIGSRGLLVFRATHEPMKGQERGGGHA